MLRKCLKYETKAFARIMLPILIANGISSTAFILVANNIKLLKGSLGILTFFAFLFLIPVMFFSMFGIPILSCFLGAKRYNDVMFSEQAYLMRTLPVSGRTLIICILVNSLIWYVISFLGIFIFTAVPVATVVGDRNVADNISATITWVVQNREQIFQGAVYIFTALIYTECLIFLSITFASRISGGKWIFTFLFFMLFRFLFTIPETIIMIIFLKEESNKIGEIITSFSSLIPSVSRGILSVIIIAYLLITVDKNTEVK